LNLEVVVELEAPRILEVGQRGHQIDVVIGETVVPAGHSHPVMRARRHGTVHLHGSEEVVLCELRIIRAGGPTDEVREGAQHHGSRQHHRPQGPADAAQVYASEGRGFSEEIGLRTILLTL
jgi:hypothetical protein